MAAEKRKMRELKQLFHDFSKEASVEGTLIEIRPGEYGKLFDIKKDDNEVVTLPTKTVLETKLKENLVGKFIRVTYLGEKKSGKNKKYSYEDFKVEVED